ncbi:MAG: 6,7-dimethyl-8-ribityllumazine synthase [Spirochaetales bacterium]|nr:6,7-dimethyl-8-ribityllumazine synthase [Spirochaetales bacterium]
MTEISVKLNAEGRNFALVIGRFYSQITEQLEKGACEALLHHGTDEQDIVTVRVPGAFEIPLAAKKLAESGLFDAVICLGAVIRGGMAPFEFVASETAKGIARVSLDTGIPVIFGVLISDSIEQALERAGTKAGNHGFNAAVSAIEMVNLLKEIDCLESTDSHWAE